jgi:5-methylthioadenosine/S-adenosylhomocysteine deaminase
MANSSSAAPPVAVDLAITHALVVCADEAGTVVDDGLVLVRGGELVHVGPAVPYEAARTLDAGGAPVLPGLVNAHTHLAMTLFRGLADDRDLDGFLAALVPAEVAVLSPDAVAAGTELAVAECLLGGITSALDMYWFPERALEVAAGAGLRLHAGPVFMQFDGPDNRPFGARRRWAERWLADPPPTLGSAAWLNAHSTYLLTEPQLREIAEVAETTRARVHVHAAETAAELRQVAELHGGRTPVEVLAHTGLLGPRTVLAHGVHLTGPDIELVAQAGASVAHNPASNLKLASGIAPVPELLAAGVTVALGTDGPASGNDLDLWLAMRLAAYTQKARTGDASVLPAGTMVRMATAAGARALGVDRQVGSLEVGRRADVVVLDSASPSLTPVYDASSALAGAAGRGDVRHVIVDGRLVVEDHRCLTVDVERAAARVRRLAPSVAAAVPS